ncbi:hypothetical protein FACS1894182_10140 [Bacteroidia bacterium]|nr:hypothetical protein FACS1894182_10140 [Bacteroidia bacterium]
MDNEGVLILKNENNEKTTVFLLLSIPGILSAQHSIETAINMPCAGDEIVKQQVEYKDPGDSGLHLVWDFRFLQPINEEYTLSYFLPDSANIALLCGLEHNTRYYYRQGKDSLWAIGYENTTTTMNYTQPELQLCCPLQYGKTFTSNFEGEGEYGRMLPISITGETRWLVDAEGTLLLPDARIEKALRVHSILQYTESRKLQAIITVNKWSWFAPGVRYPVFESIQTTNSTSKEKKTVFNTSFYCPPQLQTGDTIVQTLSPDDIRSIFTEAQLFPNPVRDYLTVRYKLTRPAQIWFTVHDQQGILKKNVALQWQTEGHYTQTVDMHSLPAGIYMLYAHVDDQVVAFNLIKL